MGSYWRLFSQEGNLRSKMHLFVIAVSEIEMFLSYTFKNKGSLLALMVP